jgi:phosphohistidine swiveling domain-containing protein
MIDPKKKLFKWGPVDGKILYIESFVDFAVSYKKKLQRSWPDFFIHTKNSKILVILENDKLRKHGEELFKEYILNIEKSQETYDYWEVLAKKVEELCYKHRNYDLSKLSQEELNKELKDFFEIYEEFWIYGFISEISNWGGEKIIIELIKERHPNHFNEIFEALTAPEKLSFYQVEERDLLTGDIKEHVKKYFWINNSYGMINFLNLNYFEERLSKLSTDKINEINNYTSKTKLKKEEIKKKFSVDENLMNIASKLSFSIWWQDLRKKYTFMALHVINHISKEIAERNNLTIEEVEMYNPPELNELAEKNKKVDLEKRKKGYLSYYNEETNTISYHNGEEANEIIKKYTSIKVNKGITEFKGMVASRGKAVGKVRILSGARHFDSMKEGEILVSSMTSPEFIIAMRKTAAIITDEGGITCHAAIVSRELSIPCIVGTSIATRTLNNGDLVEVDANKGIVKILKRSK